MWVYGMNWQNQNLKRKMRWSLNFGKNTTFVKESDIAVVHGFASDTFGKEAPQIKPNFADRPKSLLTEVIYDAQIQITCKYCGGTPCWWPQLQKDIKEYVHFWFLENCTVGVDCAKARKLAYYRYTYEIYDSFGKRRQINMSHFVLRDIKKLYSEDNRSYMGFHSDWCQSNNIGVLQNVVYKDVFNILCFFVMAIAFASWRQWNKRGLSLRNWPDLWKNASTSKGTHADIFHKHRM